MDIKKLLLALYPKEWRETFGEEFTALLEETHLSARVVLDVLVQAGKSRIISLRGILMVCAALIASAFFDVVALRTGLSANILWAPTNLERALMLIATVAPWLVVARITLKHHQRRSADLIHKMAAK